TVGDEEEELAPAVAEPEPEPTEAREGADRARESAAAPRVEAEKKVVERPAKASAPAAASGATRPSDAPAKETLRGAGAAQEELPSEEGAAPATTDESAGKTHYKSLPAALPEVPIAVPDDTSDLATKPSTAPPE